jgi:hypothetical protein
MAPFDVWNCRRAAESNEGPPQIYMEEENFNLQCKYSILFGFDVPNFDILNTIEECFLKNLLNPKFWENILFFVSQCFMLKALKYLHLEHSDETI